MKKDKEKPVDKWTVNTFLSQILLAQCRKSDKEPIILQDMFKIIESGNTWSLGQIQHQSILYEPRLAALASEVQEASKNTNFLQRRISTQYTKQQTWTLLAFAKW